MSRAKTEPEAGLRVSFFNGEPVLFLTVPEGERANGGDEIAMWTSPKALLRIRAELDAAWRKVPEDQRNAAKRAMMIEPYTAS